MKPKCPSVDHVPRIRQQRSVASVWPRDASGYRAEPVIDQAIGRHVPGTLGRFPTIGLDHGHITGTRPDLND